MTKKLLSQKEFFKTLPDALRPMLPDPLKNIKVRQPWRYLIQFHYGEPWLHYEVARTHTHSGYEVGFHCESKDSRLNRYLLLGFRQHLFEIKDTLGDRIEAEMWDRGWTKIYEVIPEETLSTEYQTKVARRLAQIIICLHPIYIQLRGQVARVHR